ncbi:MAG: AMP-binding protein [Coriobacteriia bacterium]|nr:AMP-binding protein [Coriobacteriia bacterium]MBS5478657.1 AMP-binding protein [Coriobacteriia bacterium]
MLNIHQRYCTETFDYEGRVTSFRAHRPDDFNYAYDVIDAIGAGEPEKLAQQWCNPEGEEHAIRFSELASWSNRIANYLREHGIGQGDKVLVILRRHYQFWMSALALNKLGAVLVPATFMLKEHDVEYRLDACEAKAIITTTVGDIAQIIDNVFAADAARPGEPGTPEGPRFQHIKRFLVNGAQPDLDGAGAQATERDAAQFGPALSGTAGLFAAWCRRPGWLDFNSGVRAASAELERVATHADDPMLMYFTSGTSGNPKMALHSCDYPLGHITTAKYWHGVEADGVHFTIADTGWAKTAWGKFYGQWLMEGCQLVYDFDRFHANEILSLVARYHITTFCCPPTMYRMLSLDPDFDSYDLSSVDRFTTAGEALNPDMFQFWVEHTGKAIYEGFGQTETPVIVANLLGSTPKPGSMGKPVPFANIEIQRPDGSRCNPGEPGEICIECNPRPMGIVREYYKEPAKTEKLFRGGWFHTGDVAWVDEDGFFFYEGRDDDVIKSSGYRIGPFEIESVLLEHEAVRECAVTGVPDPLRGKAVKATIVLMDGFEGTEELTRELQTWVKRKTAPYKYPRIVEYVSELPKTFSGKIRRVEIRSTDAERGVENREA